MMAMRLLRLMTTPGDLLVSGWCGLVNGLAAKGRDMADKPEARTNPYAAVGVAIMKACEDLGIDGKDAAQIAKLTLEKLRDGQTA